MDKQKKEIIITIFLIAIFGFFLIRNFKPSRKKIQDKGKILAVQGNGELSGLEKEEPVAFERKIPPDIITEEQKKRAQNKWGRDPFFRVGPAEMYKNASLSLKGVSIARDKKAYAFINEQIVAVGDWIGNYEVVEIQKNRVLLQKGREEFYLVLPEE